MHQRCSQIVRDVVQLLKFTPGDSQHTSLPIPTRPKTAKPTPSNPRASGGPGRKRPTSVAGVRRARQHPFDEMPENVGGFVRLFPYNKEVCDAASERKIDFRTILASLKLQIGVKKKKPDAKVTAKGKAALAPPPAETAKFKSLLIYRPYPTRSRSEVRGNT